ncbi:ROK family protein [Sphingomonas abietis]|uniref:fructokinase n=1 Tax=Sphingomonas abietis TaxID=3012344 RepID=A0ABY7NID3_9SPHN|nr:ROK family protein [Sphingomonas abietis]WBO21280.1 ROK family protein [Sphingomonas abietis]
MTDITYLGVELGGTKCVCTLASGPDAIIAQHRIPTTEPGETLGAIERVLDDWMTDHRPVSLGLASFGPIDLDPDSPTYGHITATTKPGWKNASVAQRFARSTGLPTAIDTDVAGAALAEGRWGGAKGLSSFAYITVGTGVGAGIVVGGRSVRGLGHPEAGHMHVARMPGDAWPGACTFHGDCVEGLASGFAIEQRSGRPASEIAADDPVWAAVAHTLAGMCHNLVMTAVPERILIGGGVVTRQPQILPMVRQRLVASLAGYGDAIAVTGRIERFIASPALGDQAGPLGAIALALDAAKAGQAAPAGV